MSTAIQGWIDPKTGKSGAFDKNGNRRSWTWWENFTNWWNSIETRRMLTKTERKQKAIEKKKRQEDWKYDGVCPLSENGHAPVYVNHSLKTAYSIQNGKKCPIDYNAWTIPQDGKRHLIPLSLY